MTLINQVFLNWTTLQKDCESLFNLIKRQNINFKRIGVITRGGLFTASILSYKLDIKDIFTICVSSYNKQNEKTSISTINTLQKNEDELLILEDMVDTGETIKFLKSFFPNSTFACLYAKPKGLKQADIFVKVYKQNEWLVFPWDK